MDCVFLCVYNVFDNSYIGSGLEFIPGISLTYLWHIFALGSCFDFVSLESLLAYLWYLWHIFGIYFALQWTGYIKVLHCSGPVT